MTYLVTDTDFATYDVAYLPSNFSMAKRMNRFIGAAQMYDIKNSIGDELLIDLLAYTGSPADADYDLLLEGGTYTYNSTEYLFNGLKETVCLYAYHRYINSGIMQVTEFGLVNKINDQSERPTAEQISNLKAEILQRADESLNNVRDYLCRNSTTWPQYGRRTTNRHRVNITAIGD